MQRNFERKNGLSLHQFNRHHVKTDDGDLNANFGYIQFYRVTIILFTIRRSFLAPLIFQYIFNVIAKDKWRTPLCKVHPLGNIATTSKTVF